MPIKRSTRKVVRAFKRGEARQMSGALYTDGTVIYSQGLLIAAKSGREIIVSPPAAAFPRYVRQRIAELRELMPKSVFASEKL